MRPRRSLCLSALIVCVAALPALADEDEVVLRDGSAVHGKVMARDQGGGVTVQHADGRTTRLEGERVEEVRSTDPAGAYVRFHGYREDWSRLEVLCRTLRTPDGAREVMLAGAVHLGDLSYYRRLQTVLDDHDIVLYEGVGAPRSGDVRSLTLPGADERERQRKRPFRPDTLRSSELSELDLLTRLQAGMADSLELTFQKDGLDYSHSWWVPADVSGEELMRLFSESDRSLFSEIAAQNSVEAQALVNRVLARTLREAVRSLFSDKPLRLVLKEAFAQLLASQMEGFGASDDEDEEPASLIEEVLIIARNQEALRKLDQALQHPEAKTLVIFYGAGHMPDLERRLLSRGFTFARDEWIPAWDMRSDPLSAAEDWRRRRESEREKEPRGEAEPKKDR